MRHLYAPFVNANLLEISVVPAWSVWLWTARNRPSEYVYQARYACLALSPALLRNLVWAQFIFRVPCSDRIHEVSSGLRRKCADCCNSSVSAMQTWPVKSQQINLGVLNDLTAHAHSSATRQTAPESCKFRSCTNSQAPWRGRPCGQKLWTCTWFLASSNRLHS